jgi:hypothetical protein
MQFATVNDEFEGRKLCDEGRFAANQALWPRLFEMLSFVVVVLRGFT